MAASPTPTCRKDKSLQGGLIVLASIFINYYLYPDIPGRYVYAVATALMFLLPDAIILIMLKPMTVSNLSDARVIINSAWVIALMGLVVTIVTVGTGQWGVIAFQVILFGYVTISASKAKRTITHRHLRYKAHRQ